MTHEVHETSNPDGQPEVPSGGFLVGVWGGFGFGFGKLGLKFLGRIPWPPREISGEEAQARTRFFWA
jgi:hypothetical protein